MKVYQRHPNATCLICNKLVYRRKFELERNKGRVFCSQYCYGRSCRKEKPCVICQQPILSGLNKKTCSRACANKLRIGSTYRKSYQKDKVKFYRSLKIKLLKTKGLRCQRCGYNKFEILQIHHIDRNHSNNELSNLELICPNCHYEEHYLKKSWFKNWNIQGEVA